MSANDMIKQGLVLKRKQEIMGKIIQAKTALRSLINDATYAQDKHPREVNSDILQAQLDNFKSAQADIKRLYEEIEELEY